MGASSPKESQKSRMQKNVTIAMLIISLVLFVYIIYLQLKILELAPETRATFIFIDILVIAYLGVEIYREIWRKQETEK
ncbi:MAG: hypothetical protein ACFE68_05855 [Candidatus Hodarchaeota archaeon]